MLTIAYAFHRDAANPAVQSGRPCSILRAFRRAGVAVRTAFPLARPVPFPVRLKKLAYHAVGQGYRADREPALLAGYAHELQERLRDQSFDVLFSPGSEVLSHLALSAPLTFCADTTFAGLVDYYWDFKRLSREYLRRGHAQEQAALDRAALAVFPSPWAAQRAVDFYGVNARKIAVIPFGANFGADNQAAEVLANVERRNLDTVELLFVGRHWRRKGGDLVVAAAEELRARGRRVRVHVVGCAVPLAHRGRDWIVPHGSLDPARPAERERLHALFTGAHFLFVPSRAEAYGMVFCEANAFGLPVLTTATGGIPAIVRDGVNGFALPPEAEGRAYADHVERVLDEPDRYERMARDSFGEFERRLNWDAFCRSYLETVATRVLSHPAADDPGANDPEPARETVVAAG